MTTRYLLQRSLTVLLGSVLFALCFAVLQINAQTKPLTLAEVLTGLQAKTGDFTKQEKNNFIAQAILKRGVTFKLSPVIETELKQVGASANIFRAIRIKTPTKTVTRPVKRPPSAKVESIWVDQNVTQKGVRGILVHAKFNVYNLKGVNSQLYIRFQNQANTYLRSSNKKYANKRGELALYKTKLKPIYTATVFNDTKVFLPYREINLSRGTHNLRIVANLLFNNGSAKIMPVGKQNFSLVQPVKPSARFVKLWVDYGKKQNGMLGMIVHFRFNVANLKDSNAQIAIGFSRQTGRDPTTKRLRYGVLKTSVMKYKSVNGQVTLYKNIKPAYASAVFKDLKLFVPYEAFNLSSGKYVLKMHADLLYPDGGMLQHFGEKAFSYSKR